MIFDCFGRYGCNSQDEQNPVIIGAKGRGREGGAWKEWAIAKGTGDWSADDGSRKVYGLDLVGSGVAKV